MANIKFKIGSTFYSIPTIKGDKGDTGSIADLGGVIANLTPKTTPVDGDSFVISDSASANVEKRLSLANIKATLRTYFEGFFTSRTPNGLIYYVSTTGSDSNNGLSSGTAFRTITYALNLIPKNVQHTVTINVEAGTYNESVNIDGFFGGGELRLYGGTDLATAVNFKVNQINIQDTSCPLTVRGFEVTASSGNSFYVINATYALITYCLDTTASTGIFIYAISSALKINTCLASNKGHALFSVEGSQVLSEAWSAGSNNTVGLRAGWGGIILKSGTQPQGATSEEAGSGGIITGGVLNPAPLASPAFTGTPTAPTAVAGTNTTQIATTAFVNTEIAADAVLKVSGSPVAINGIWSGTQAQYDALGTKDANTLYFIV